MLLCQCAGSMKTSSSPSNFGRPSGVVYECVERERKREIALSLYYQFVRLKGFIKVTGKHFTDHPFVTYVY